MNVLKPGAMIIMGVIFVGGAQLPAAAASPITDAFLSNLVPNVDFLDRSSRFALQNSKNTRIRDFAHAEAREQTLAANALDDWIEADKAVAAPQTVASAPATSDAVTTGRSVAVDGPVTQGAPAQAPVADNRLHLGQEDLDSLEGLEGGEFDSLYKTKQLDALTQIQTDYEDYLVKGDNPALRDMASKELPKIKLRLGALRKL
jgi:predicted outer membrane protein